MLEVRLQAAVRTERVLDEFAHSARGYSKEVKGVPTMAFPLSQYHHTSECILWCMKMHCILCPSEVSHYYPPARISSIPRAYSIRYRYITVGLAISLQCSVLPFLGWLLHLGQQWSWTRATCMMHDTHSDLQQYYFSSILLLDMSLNEPRLKFSLWF